MGREVRRVPKDWQHPRIVRVTIEGPKESFVPLNNYKFATESFQELKARARKLPRDDDGWPVGLVELLGEYNKAEYMPDFGDKATHYMMYETCSEGTPISPAFATPEELARWLADTGASIFGHMTATYDEWLRIASHKATCIGLVVNHSTVSPAILSK